MDFFKAVDAPSAHTANLGRHDTFTHTPLDHTQASIRLVQVLPSLSAGSEGRIQCTISHASVNASYECLSYRWGDEYPVHEISINSQLYPVRQNLFDFLNAARARAVSTTMHSDASVPYWIDALCIDQSNIPERNQQVAQMGQIFSNALAVHMWLGLTPPSLSPLLKILGNAKESTFDDWSTVRANKDVLVGLIVNNDYWTRAWITQEIILAKRITVWLGEERIEFKELSDGIQYFYLATPGDAFSKITDRWRQTFRPESMIALLSQFGDKQCQDHRDRIFSLISLCSDEGRNIKVDYNMSTSDLAVRVLQACKSSLCFCSALRVVQALDLQGVKSLGLDQNAQLVPCLELDAVASMKDPSGTERVLRSSYIHHQSIPDGTTYYNFFDTCEAINLQYSEIRWKNDFDTSERRLHWGHTSHLLTQDLVSTHSTLVEAEDFETKPTDFIVATPTPVDEVKENIVTIRIAFWLLARIFQGQQIEICRLVKESRTRSRDIPIRYPRMHHSLDGAESPLQGLPPLDSHLQYPLDTKRLRGGMYGRRPPEHINEPDHVEAAHLYEM